jgi:uncharacterized protein YqeY
MAIIEQIDKDFMQAFKGKNEGAVSTLRLISAALKYEKIKKMAELTDEDAIKVLKSEIKKRKEAIFEYEKGQRPELAAKEKAEMALIEKYLPAQMSEDDVRIKVQTILQSMDDKENMGKVMGRVMAELKGQADGTVVKKIVEELLK